jgi:peptidoglycan/xylan/chitin deacetylase (PgdA/CDA1 family)
MNKVYMAFPGGKSKVLTLSYDDGKTQDLRLLEIFNKYGIKATFNLNSGLTYMDNRIKEKDWAGVYEGHEVAVHTSEHPTITRCNNAYVINQILEDKMAIEKYFKKPITGIAYPNGAGDERIASLSAACGLKYGRIACDKYAEVYSAKALAKEAEGPILLGDPTGFDMPDNYLLWKPTCHHNHHLLDFTKSFISLKKRHYLYMFYVWGHSFEFDRNDNWNLIEEFAEMISKQDDIWYATNGQIVENKEIFERLEFAADNSFVYNPSAKSCWVRINDDHYEEIPAGQLHFFESKKA